MFSVHPFLLICDQICFSENIKRNLGVFWNYGFLSFLWSCFCSSQIFHFDPDWEWLNCSPSSRARCPCMWKCNGVLSGSTGPSEPQAALWNACFDVGGFCSWSLEFISLSSAGLCLPSPLINAANWPECTAEHSSTVAEAVTFSAASPRRVGARLFKPANDPWRSPVAQPL